MSYILEALKKSERERQLGQAPALADVVSEGITPSRPRGWLWSGVAGVILIVINGGLLFYAWHKGVGLAPSGTLVPASSTPPVAAIQPSAQSTPPAEEAEKAALARKLLELEGRIAQMDASKRLPVPVTADVKGTTPPGDAEASAESELRPAATKKPVDVQDKVAPKSDKKSTSKREALASDDAKSAPRKSAAEHPGGEPSIEDDMPDGVRTKMSVLKINMLAYSSQPEERFAVIDMVKYTEGERLPNGAQLLEIRADSVVVKLNGVKYRVANH